MEIISFEGLEELLTRLEQIERELETVKDEALIAGGDKLKEAIQSEVYSHGLQRRSGEAQQAIVRTDPKNGELFVGTQGGARRPGFYLYMHEFGYYNVRAGRFISPKPLVSIVFERMRTQILEAEAAVIRRRLGL